MEVGLVDTSALGALFWLLAIALSTPGPNALTCFGHSGLYGSRSNVKLIAGMLIGIFIMELIIGLSIEALKDNTTAMTALHWIGMMFLAFMIIGLFRFDPSSVTVKDIDAVLGLKTGVLMQFFNGKEWAFIIIIMSRFIQPFGGGITGILVIASITLSVCFAAMSAWTLIGARLESTFRDQGKGKNIFRVCGILLSLLLIGFLIQGPSNL